MRNTFFRAWVEDVETGSLRIAGDFAPRTNTYDNVRCVHLREEFGLGATKDVVLIRTRGIAHGVLLEPPIHMYTYEYRIYISTV